MSLPLLFAKRRPPWWKISPTTWPYWQSVRKAGTAGVDAGTVTATGVTTGGWGTLTLFDGRVFIAGQNSASQIYDPVTDTAVTATGVTSQKSGCVPMADGRVFCNADTGSAQIYDPVTDTAVTATGAAAKYGAVLLNDGRVLVGNLPKIYDPATDTTVAASAAGGFLGARMLPDGRVFCPGFTAISRIYDPVTNTSVTATGTLAGSFSATQLLDGRVFIARRDSTPGGQIWNGGYAPPSAGMVFNAYDNRSL